MRSYRDNYIINKIHQLEEEIEIHKENYKNGIKRIGFYSFNAALFPSIYAAHKHYSSDNVEQYIDLFKESVVSLLPVEIIIGAYASFNLMKTIHSKNKQKEYENEITDLEDYLIRKYHD